MPASADPLDHDSDTASEGDATWRSRRLTALTERFGGSVETIGRYFEREFPEVAPGWYERRPHPSFVGDLRAEMWERPLQDLWRQVACPYLMFFCTATDTNEPELILNMHAMNAARNRWLAGDLALLVSECPNVEVEEIDATHAGILGRSSEVGDRILAFLGLDPS